MSKSRDLGEFPAAALDIDASGNLDVTGTVTADGLTVDGELLVDSTTQAFLKLDRGSAASHYALTRYYTAGTEEWRTGTYNDNSSDFHIGSPTTKNVSITQGGDISFYEDTGTTPKFFWDASAESLGIGSSTVRTKLDLVATTSATPTDFNSSTILLEETGVNKYAGLTFLGGNNTGATGTVAKLLVQNTNTSGGFDGAMIFSTRNASSMLERMRIDSSGNCGIGTSTILSPAAGRGVLTLSGSASSFLNFGTGSTRWGGVYSDATKTVFLSDNIATFEAGNVERMRITSAGDLALGSTNAYSHRFFARGSGADETVGLAVGANNTNVIRFYSSTLGTAGAIRVSAAGTSVAYNTSSDYRLKEDDIPMTGATERVKALRPINFAWKADGSRVDGFFAHELAEVVPEAASGAKDAMMDEEYEVTPAVVDAEGVETEAAVMGTRSVPDYQGIDQSKLVPLLTATIQELIARIEILEAK